MRYIPYLCCATALLLASCSSKSKGDATGAAQPDDYEHSVLAGCTNLVDSQEVSFYIALKDVAYCSEPSLNAVNTEYISFNKGDIFSPGITTDVSEYDADWYQVSWRGEEVYYPRNSFEKHSYKATTNFFCSYLQEHNPLCFADAKGNTAIFYILDKRGYNVEIGEEVNIQDPETLYMVELNGSSLVLEDADGVVNLISTNMFLEPADTENYFGNPIVSHRLCTDACLSSFYDPDFITEIYFVPSEMAILIDGRLYHHINTANLDKEVIGVKGNVHSVTDIYNDWRVSYYFDKQGCLASVRNGSEDYDLVRNLYNPYLDSEQSVFDSLQYTLCLIGSDSEFSDTYYISLSDRRLLRNNCSEEGIDIDSYYLYGKDGALDRINTHVCADLEENDYDTTDQVVVNSTDEQGNWTSRTVGSETHTREITYY